MALAILLAPLAITGSAHAAPEPIWDGLWSGSNFDLGAITGKSSPPKKKIYAAVGDSVAAGLGLAPKANPKGNDTRCGRSSRAYPNTVSKHAGLPIVFLPCSGATAGDLVTKQDVDGTLVPAQLQRAYHYGNPELITITTGANDAHWSTFIRACYATDCATGAYTKAANAYLLSLQAKLHAAFLYIDGRSLGDPPQVITTGYYNPTSASCADVQTAVTPAELKWIAAETKALNQTISDVAAHYRFVTYAPVSFTGHDICSRDSWVQGLDDAAPLHPTAAGQKAFARAVIKKL
jgi:lysophospholipase L1-like esterase